MPGSSRCERDRVKLSMEEHSEWILAFTHSASPQNFKMTPMSRRIEYDYLITIELENGIPVKLTPLREPPVVEPGPEWVVEPAKKKRAQAPRAPAKAAAVEEGDTAAAAEAEVDVASSP